MYHRSSVIGHIDNAIPQNLLPYQIGRLLSNHYGTCGYIISKQCAKRLFDSIKCATAPIDETYFNLRYGMLRELNVQQMIPAIVIQQPGIKSTIGEQRQKQENKSKKRTIGEKIEREMSRLYRKKILPLWQTVVRGYRIGKVDFY